MIKGKSFISIVLLTISLASPLAMRADGPDMRNVKDSLILGDTVDYKGVLNTWSPEKLVTLREQLSSELNSLKEDGSTNSWRLDRAKGLCLREPKIGNALAVSGILTATLSCFGIATIAGYRALKTQLDKNGYGDRVPALAEGRVDHVTTTSTITAGTLFGVGMSACILSLFYQSIYKKIAAKQLITRISGMIDYIDALLAGKEEKKPMTEERTPIEWCGTRVIHIVS